MEREYSVYCHTFPNGKRYIGISSDCEKRWRNGKGYETQPKMDRAIKKYGWDNFQHIIVYENLTKEDTIDLGSLGEGKKALFVIIPAADSTYNFLVSMMYSQLFETLYFVAETKYEGKRLKTPVRFLLDEFANIGQIPNLEKLMATIRSREISACLVLQAKSQLKAIYKDNSDTIIGNCDTYVYLGGNDVKTAKAV